MRNHTAGRVRRSTVLVLALALTAVAALAGPALAAAAPPPALTFKVAQVAAPGNSSVGIVPFTDANHGSVMQVLGRLDGS